MEIFGAFHWGVIMEIKKINGDLCHDKLFRELKPKLTFSEDLDFNEYRKTFKDKFLELIGYEDVVKNAGEHKITIEKTEEKDGYKQIRFTFESEIGTIVPCYLLVPNGNKEKYPVVITLQGHSSGFHNSIGEPKDESENEYALGRGQFAVQAVKNGYVALAIEQRCMGERCTTRYKFSEFMCLFPAMRAISLGRTVLAERIYDVQVAIDLLKEFPVCDTDKIVITGNSGGGTASFYASAVDERIKISAPSCSFCTYKSSIFDIVHCSCNYIPNSAKWFEMQDIASLIAPRNLIIIAGKKDKIFPIEGVREGFEVIKRIYKTANAENNCSLVETEKHHYWCEDLVFNAINKEVKKLGW